jgi:methylthioribose-1-phosphate isomerase
VVGTPTASSGDVANKIGTYTVILAKGTASVLVAAPFHSRSQYTDGSRIPIR